MTRDDHYATGIGRFLTAANAPRVLGVAFALAGVIMCCVATYMWWTAERLHDHGQVAEATVVGLDRGSRSKASDRVVVRFTSADGRDVTARVGDWDWDNGAAVGQTQTVLYDPDDPASLVADTRVGPRDDSRFLYAGTGLAAMVFGALLALGRIRLPAFPPAP